MQMQRLQERLTTAKKEMESLKSRVGKAKGCKLAIPLAGLELCGWGRAHLKSCL